MIAYKVSPNVMLFYMVGLHENFFRNLKKHLKEDD